MVPQWFLTLSFWINKISYLQFMACATVYSVLLYLLGYSYSGLVFLSTMVMTVGTVGVIKLVTRVQRPEGCLVELQGNRAFPSGHTAAMAFVATMVPYTLPFSASLSGVYALGTLLMCATLVVGLSRLALRAHTPVQIIAGFILGVTIPILAITYINPPLVEWLLLSL